jgi:lipocalin
MLGPASLSSFGRERICTIPKSTSINLFLLKNESITGYAVGSNPNVEGELKVYLDKVPVPGQYWIYGLGPTVDGQYSYSIVSDEYFITLFVLVRDISYYENYLKDQINQEITNIGYKHIYNVDLVQGLRLCVA